ncbi:MAG: zinc metalloprotease HtpX [Spirochaetota bacterium]
MIRVRTNTTLQTLLLAAALAGVALVAGWQLVGGWAILMLAGFFAAVGISVMQTEPRIRLRGARELRYFEAPDLFDTVEALARRAGLRRVPDLYYVRSRLLNAATIGGRENAAILVTDGVLSALPRRELEGVLAHEIAHIKNNDLSLFRIAEILRQATLLFTRAGWLLVLFALPLVLFAGGLSFGALLALAASPPAGRLLQLALLRTREFAADATAAELTGDPEGLASALQRIEYAQRGVLQVLLPVRGDQEGSLFRTHPQTDERVARLRSLRVRRAGGGTRAGRIGGYAGGVGFASR